MKLPTIGDYPIEYKPEVHGPYDPSRYYGKPDTPFGQVKLAELPAWFGRRNKSVRSFAGLISRATWRWTNKYRGPKVVHGAFFLQFCVGNMLLYYITQYPKMDPHRHAKYH